jgi:tRNA 2-selenouridine synthase
LARQTFIMREDSADFREIFLSGAPLLDARAPVEFCQGAFPGAVNLPLMNDLERQQVGTCYKQHGQQAAIALGHQLVSGAVKQQRIAAWADFARAHPDGYLYCFRGGLRSRIVQQWLREEAGLPYPRVEGGYKAMRGYLMGVTQEAIAQCGFAVLGGLTGTGKTEVLRQLDNSLDLEGHAHHRGSSFGRRASPQPAQIDFEHRLALDILRKRHAGHASFVLEDESRIIGSCNLPIELHQAMQHWPIVWLEDSLDNRVERILRDYVIDLSAEYAALHGPQQGFALFALALRQSLDRIVKRLGGERHQRLAALMDAALQTQARSGDTAPHRAWIEGLLNEYYDPMYQYQRTLKSPRIVFSGDQAAVTQYLLSPAAL